MFVETKEAGEVQQAPAKTMKLSEAIRIGARFRPQCHTSYMRDGRSCAIGAAAEALGEPYWEGQGCGTVLHGKGFSWDLIHKVSALNDHEKWTREEIAEWLESQGL